MDRSYQHSQEQTPAGVEGANATERDANAVQDTAQPRLKYHTTILIVKVVMSQWTALLSLHDYSVSIDGRLS